MTWPEPPIDPKDVPRLLELCAGERQALEAVVWALTATLRSALQLDRSRVRR